MLAGNYRVMDKTEYHAALKKMQESGASSQYCHGWASGALANTALEEQRVTDDYTAGYEDGQAGITDGYTKWISD